MNTEIFDVENLLERVAYLERTVNALKWFVKDQERILSEYERMLDEAGIDAQAAVK